MITYFKRSTDLYWAVMAISEGNNRGLTVIVHCNCLPYKVSHVLQFASAHRFIHSKVYSDGNHTQGSVTRNPILKGWWRKLLHRSQNPASESPLIPDQSRQKVPKPRVQGEVWISSGIRKASGAEFEVDTMLFWSLFAARASWWPHSSPRWPRGTRAQSFKGDISVSWYTHGSKGKVARRSMIGWLLT